MWKKIDKDTKMKYEDAYAKKKAVYEEQYRAFFDSLPQFRKDQELATKRSAKRLSNRRASVGEEYAEVIPQQTDQCTNSTFIGEVKKPEGTAAKRVRALTIDCRSPMNISEFFKVKENVPFEATPIKKAPLSKKDTLIAKATMSVKRSTKRKVEEEAPEMTCENLLPSKKAKNNQKPVKNSSNEEQDKENSSKQTETKECKVVLETLKKTCSVPQEPLRPPASVKAYFESIYTGDKSKAKKEYKKLPLTEKEKYHEELKLISKKYLEDLAAYMNTLSKEVRS